MRTYVHDLGEVDVFLEPETSRADGRRGDTASPVGLELLRTMRGLGWRTVLVEPQDERVLAGHREHADEVRGDLDVAEVGSDTAVVPHRPRRAGRGGDAGAALSDERRVHRDHRDPPPRGRARQRRTGRGLHRRADRRGSGRRWGSISAGESPAEIALSIAAGLVAARSGRDGGWLDRARPRGGEGTTTTIMTTAPAPAGANEHGHG